MTRTTYEDRVRRVVRYIHENPAGDLSLDALADVAAMSRFHWHRVFHAMTSETCAQAVRRIRAHRAACWLVQTDLPLSAIADRAGYTNAQSFARTFRALYGVTPAQYRSTGAHGALDVRLTKGTHRMIKVDIKHRPEIRLAALPHRGAYNMIGAAFQEVAAVFNARGLWPQARGMVGIYHDDPNAVPEAELRSNAGIRVEPDFEMPEGLEDVRIAAGDQAVMLYTGPYDGLPAAWHALYADWLPDSGREPADAASFEIYLNDPMDTAPEQLQTELCIPLRSL